MRRAPVFLSSIVGAALLAAPALASTPAVPSRLSLPALDGSARIALAQASESAPAPALAPAKPRGSDIWRAAVLPGWGQWRAGHREVGLAFFVLDAAAWSTMAISIGQGHLRRGASEDTARDFAGIDLTAVDDDFRRRVSEFPSSEEYNRLVVMRDAAALYYGEFDDYNRYIDEHELTGDEAWEWESPVMWERYRQERRSSQRAFHRAKFAAAALVANRVASAVVTSRLRPKAAATATSAAPPSGPRARIVWGVAADPSGGLEPRLGYVLRF